MIRLLLGCALLAALPRAAAAQEALVLSGGGARGLAHVGALEGLEERGYDPDLVVGTSMGALVGALYAAGYTPEEIRERILAIDWNALFAPTPVVIGPGRSVRYPLLSYALNVGGDRVARGVIAQWRINRALALLLFDANARARGDFDRLARRYRAVAAELRTGRAVVLAEGDLAVAARASIAVPGVFAPVPWGDHLLVDGGIADNLPTGVAREMGARRVIAVDVTRPAEEIHSQTPVMVLARSLDLMLANVQGDPVPPDALVLPRLDPGYTAATFPTDPTPLFELGLEAARRDLPPSPPSVGRGERPLPLPPDSLHGLLVEAPDPALAELARRIFAGVAPGRYDPEAVLAAMDRLYTTGLVEAVWPRVIENPDTGFAAPVLLVRVDAPPRLAISAAAGYENDRGARAWTSLDRYSRLGRLPAVLGASVSMDGMERWASLAGRVHALRPRTLAWSLGAYLKERDVRRFEADALSNTDVLRAGVWTGLELPHILSDRVASLGVHAEYVAEEGGRRGASVGPVLRLTSLNPDILVVGVPLLVEAEHRWGAVPYSRLALSGSRMLDLSGLLLAGLADLRVTSRGAPGDVVPALGDGHAVPGLQWGEEPGRARVVVGTDVAHPFLGAFARLRLRTGAVSGDLQAWKSADWITGAQVGLVWRNPIATVEWGFGASTRGDRRFDVSVGRHF